MLRMDQVHVLRYKVLPWARSMRRVARELELSRNMVSKYLEQRDPVWKPRQLRPRPVLELVKPRLNEAGGALAAARHGQAANHRHAASSAAARAEGCRMRKRLVCDHFLLIRRQPKNCPHLLECGLLVDANSSTPHHSQRR